MFKKYIQKRLEKYVKKYIAKHKPRLIVVTGSVGKTSTKAAIATVLSENYRVRAHDGNHNTEMSVPLAILGISYPEDVRSIMAWLRVFRAARLRIRQPTDVDVIVQELGTDKPGDVATFGRYLRPDIAVVTAVSPEHMEFFKTIDVVAAEELSVAEFSASLLINRDDIDSRFAQYARTSAISTYGLSDAAEYRIVLDPSSPLDGKLGTFIAPNIEPVPVNIQLIGTHNVRAAAAAGAVALMLQMAPQQISIGIAKIVPTKGRMNILRGINQSTIIDDTYNASPLAVEAALETLYSAKAPHRVAVLGSMNELGDMSVTAHGEIGHMCDPSRLDWLVTIGEEAKAYLAPAAESKGCQVRTFTSPYEAGGFVRSIAKPGTVILVKGSQNGVFAEETVKTLLHDSADEEQLVRQSSHWLDVKQAAFDKTTPVE